MSDDPAVYMQIVYSFIIACTRVYVFFSTAPILSSNMLTGLVKATVVMSLAITATPHVYSNFPEYELLYFFILIIKEIVIALLLSMFLWVPFYSLEIAGAIHDTMSGQTLSEDFNPLSNAEATETSKIFTQVFGAYLFVSGMFLYFLKFIYSSYKYIPVNSLQDAHIFNFSVFSGTLYNIFLYALIFLTPFFIIYFCIDMGIAIVAKFASNLNVLSYNSTSKSMVSALVIGVYIEPLIVYVEKLYVNNIIMIIDLMRALYER